MIEDWGQQIRPTKGGRARQMRSSHTAQDMVKAMDAQPKKSGAEQRESDESQRRWFLPTSAIHTREGSDMAKLNCQLTERYLVQSLNPASAMAKKYSDVRVVYTRRKRRDIG